MLSARADTSSAGKERSKRYCFIHFTQPLYITRAIEEKTHAHAPTVIKHSSHVVRLPSLRWIVFLFCLVREFFSRQTVFPGKRHAWQNYVSSSSSSSSWSERRENGKVTTQIFDLSYRVSLVEISSARVSSSSLRSFV